MGTKNSKKTSVKKKPSKQSKQPLEQTPKHHHRFLKWTSRILGGLLILILLIFIWFRVSPYPGAMLIRWVFNNNSGSKQMSASLHAHGPKSGIITIRDQQYRDGDKDAKLDVHIPESALNTGTRLPVVIWTHGGAWLSGDKADWAPYFKLIAQEGYTVVAPNYSLAPQKTYPTPVFQLNDMYAYVQANADRFHADMSKIVLAGDSAGSQLSAQMAALITNPTYADEVGIVPALKPEQLKGVILACGIYKMEELADPGPDLPKIISWGDSVTVWAYSGTRDFSDPVIRQMSPYYHITKDFPSTYITGGNDDPLTDVQSKPFADKLETLGVSVTRLFFEPNYTPPLPHEYQFNLDTDAGKEALKQILSFVRSQTD